MLMPISKLFLGDYEKERKNFERKIYLFAIVQKIFYKRRLSYGK